MRHRSSILSFTLLATAISLAAPASAGPPSPDEALVTLGIELAGAALGLPPILNRVTDSQGLPAQAGEVPVVLLTLSDPGGGPGTLNTLVWNGARWVLSEAAALPTSARTDMHWAQPRWIAGRRMLVLEATRGPAFGDDARCEAGECWTSRRFFVVLPDGRLWDAGDLSAESMDAPLRTDARCAWLGARAHRCWTPPTLQQR